LSPVWVGIEEDVAVIERREEPDVARQQHAVAEHVADMPPMPRQ
jgi:hypothetical protein